jgi:hypothetical protein
LTFGGDERLSVDWLNTGVNKYWVSPKPRPEVISRSSCTASPPTAQGFGQAEALRQKLFYSITPFSRDRIFSDAMEDIRHRLGTLLGINTGSDQIYMITTPSGTDSELVITQLALSRSSDQQRRKKHIKTDRTLVHNILVAADEIGSGSVCASAMRHYYRHTPNGRYVAKGPVDGVGQNTIAVTSYPTRSNGHICRPRISALEDRIETCIRASIVNKGQVVVLHMVAGTKTGLCIPRPSFLQRMKQTYAENLIAVVDLAQMRCDERCVRNYLRNDYCVMITGSKFFGGPSFCGAVLIPASEARSIGTAVPGLGDYITRYDIDKRLDTLRQTLPQRYNWGLLLRWTAALDNIERYLRIARDRRHDIITQWVDSIRYKIAKTPHIDVFETDQDITNLPYFSPTINTMICVLLRPLHVNRTQPGAAMDYDSLKIVYRLMSEDILHLLPQQSNAKERGAASRKCLLGQPVQIRQGRGGYGVLRIALGATEIIRCAQSQAAFKQITEEDQLLIDKLSLIAKYWRKISE